MTQYIKYNVLSYCNNIIIDDFYMALSQKIFINFNSQESDATVLFHKYSIYGVLYNGFRKFLLGVS